MLKDSMQFIYQCPVCGGRLTQANKSFVCEQNHTYDISREGYVNLLLANQKNAKEPGDGKFMVENRQDFLDKGYYDPLSDEVNKVVCDFLAGAGVTARADDAAGDETIANGGVADALAGANADCNMLDLGCGVGFYSGKLKKALNAAGLEDRARIYGIDISKPAIQKASKSYSGVNFCVGSNFRLPFADKSMDIIFSIFSPFDSGEVFRVLKPGGIILLVRPGSNHLKELGELIYDRFQLQGNPLDLSADLDVSPVEKYRLKYEIHMENNEDIMNLVSMTPYYWHLNAENKVRLAGLREFTASMDFQLSSFRL